MTAPVVSREVINTTLRLCEGIGTPRAQTVFMMVKHGEWDQLVNLKVDPSDYFSADRLRGDLAVTSLLRKMADLPIKVDLEARALETFFDCEKQCALSNSYLRNHADGEGIPASVWPIDRVLSIARERISRILGRLPQDVLGRHGPGATFSDRGKLTTAPDKMSGNPTFTSAAWPVLINWAGTAWATACADPELVCRRDPVAVRGNRFTTVPKDATKHRGIAVEPSINLFYQLGYGREIRSRLRAAGIDLTHGQEVHVRLAREASVSGAFATVDLSNASDTISRELVRSLLPREWFEELDLLRSHYTLVKGKWVRLEKFSSMGNGFTFELETLIFLGLACAVLEVSGVEAVPGWNVFVYGDDIIIPTAQSHLVISLLQYCGLTTNVNKTFTTGHFRESCGGDFFKGADVRPHFLKTQPKEPHEYISLANGIRRVGSKGFPLLDDRYRRAWWHVLDCLPSSIRSCRGPTDLGDLCIHDDFSSWNVRVRSGIRYVRVWRPARFVRVGWQNFRPPVVLASALLSVGDGLLGVTPRGSVAGYKVGWVPCS